MSRGLWSLIRCGGWLAGLSCSVRLTLVKVMASMMETQPVSDEAVEIIHTQLLPLATVLTLSTSEAVSLLGRGGAPYQPDVRNLDDLIRLAKALFRLGPQYVLLKGDQLPLTSNLEVPKSDLDKQIIVAVSYDGTDVSLIKTAYVAMGIPLGSDYALARRSSTPQTMIPPDTDYSQLQSLRISPLVMEYH